MRHQMLMQPCQPYSVRPQSAEQPVDIWAIIDRFSQQELRSLAMAFAIHAPAAFEDKILRLWDERQHARQVLNSGSANG